MTRAAMERRDDGPGGDSVECCAARLIDVLSRENHAIRTGDRAELRQSLDEKVAACAAFRSAFDREASSAGTSRSVSAGVAASLKRVQALADENARRLAAAIEANRRLLSAVAAAVSEPAPSARSYGANGSLKKVGARRYALPPPAVSLNRAF